MMRQLTSSLCLASINPVARKEGCISRALKVSPSPHPRRGKVKPGLCFDSTHILYWMLLRMSPEGGFSAQEASVMEKPWPGGNREITA